MPTDKSRHFKVDTRVGTSTAALVNLAQGSSDPHEVVVTPLSGLAKPTKLRCIRSSGSAVEYDPAPVDRWEHDFGSIDNSSPIADRTASQTVQAGQTSGSAVLQVNEIEVDDGLPQPRVYQQRWPRCDVNVTVP
jgi:hypothetical protein